MKDDIRPPKKIVDVTAPGKSAPSSSAKPIIVTNRPLVKDPMVTDANDPGSTASAPEAPADVSPESSAIHKALVLKPSDDAVQAAEATAKPDESKEDAPEDEPKDESKEVSPPAQDEPEKAPEEEKEEKAPPEEKPSDKPATESDEQADDSQAKQPTPEDEAAAEAKKQTEHDAAIQKIVTGRQYFLPINMVEKRRTKQFVALGLVLAVVLALMWVDVALDAGLIHLGGIKPLTHFFST